MCRDICNYPSSAPPERETYSGKVKVRFVVTADSVVDNLELFGCLDGHAGHVFHASAHRRHVSVLVFLEPGALADSVIRYL